MFERDTTRRVEKIRVNRNPVARRPQDGQSDMCRLYPGIEGGHTSADADVAATIAKYQGELPADTDPADLGIAVKGLSVSGVAELL